MRACTHTHTHTPKSHWYKRANNKLVTSYLLNKIKTPLFKLQGCLYFTSQIISKYSSKLFSYVEFICFLLSRKTFVKTIWSPMEMILS